MFGDLNRAELIGNITNDLQLRYTGSGSAVLSFGLATNRRFKKQDSNEWTEETTFHNVVVWGKQAEGLVERAHKGTRIYVSGRLQTRTWDDADGKKNYKTELVCESMILLDRYERGPGSGQSSETKGSGPDDTAEKPAAKSSKAKSDNNNDVIDPDDLPF